MTGVTKAISDKVYEEVMKALNERARSGDVSNKLQAIKSAKKFGIKHVAEVFEVSRVAIMRWIKVFAEMGVEGLELKQGRGRKSVITAEEKEIIKLWIHQDTGITIKALRLKIESEFNKELGKTSTHDLMRELGYSYITPRPVHYKQDPALKTEFKKKSSKPTSSKTK